MHLTSKMRYISAQFIAYLSNDLWLHNARHANNMAQLLYKNVKDIPSITVTQNIQANAVFAELPKSLISKLLQTYYFHILDETKLEVRWMCSFNTTRNDVLEFVSTIKQYVK